MEKKKASKAGGQKSPVSKVWLCKSSFPLPPGVAYTDNKIGTTVGCKYAGVRIGMKRGTCGEVWETFYGSWSQHGSLTVSSNLQTCSSSSFAAVWSLNCLGWCSASSVRSGDLKNGYILSETSPPWACLAPFLVIRFFCLRKVVAYDRVRLSTWSYGVVAEGEKPTCPCERS